MAVSSSDSNGFLHPFRWVPEFVKISQRRLRTQGRLLLAAMAVGVIAGLGGVVFTVTCQAVVHYTLEGIAGYHAAGPAHEAHVDWFIPIVRAFSPWLLLIVPTVGGLISGWLVFRFAPEAEGHGTDAAIAAYHQHNGIIRPRVSLIKLVASAVTIGTGGSGGREGPIAQIGAGLGSTLARWLRFSVAQRRILLVAGLGAGISAIFRAPLAGALFAAEVLYRSPEFESEVILPAGLASVVAYCTFGAFFGWQPLFECPPLTFNDPWRLVPYTILALAMAFLAMIYVRTFYGVNYLFHRLRLPRWTKPALGAFLTGAIGLFVYYASFQDPDSLSVLSFGYGILQKGLTNVTTLSIFVLLLVAVGKILTTSLTIGSGGSGGVFGPSMVIGGCGAAAVGLVMHEWWPGLIPNPESCVILGMAAFFSAAAKTPFSTLIIVTEMTGDYQLILPALWVCVTAYLVSDDSSLYLNQVASRALSPAHKGGYVREVLADMKVDQFVVEGVPFPVLHPQDSLTNVLDRFGASSLTVLPVVDEKKKLLGIIDLEEVHQATRSPHIQQWAIAADLMRTDLEPLTLDMRLDRAMETFIEADVLALPVVSSDDAATVLGVIRRSDIAQTYLRHVHGQPVDSLSGDGVGIAQEKANGQAH
ncbi:MAG: chloride channel protein [Gemmataceae bacterium]